MSKPTEWWQDETPIYADEGDGQRMLWVYARITLEGHEYLLVEIPDGDGPEYGVPVLSLCNGRATRLNDGQILQGER